MANRAHTIIVVLAIKDLSIAQLIDRAWTIVEAMAQNPLTFPSPVPPLPKVRTDIAALRDAQAAFQNHTAPRTYRDDAKRTLVFDLAQLQAHVKQVASMDPPNAIWSRALHHKAPLAFVRLVSGSIKLVAKAIKGAKTYEWQYSIDGGKTWLDLPPTTKAQVTVDGLIPGSVVLFQNRAVTKDGRTNWCDPISALVT